MNKLKMHSPDLTQENIAMLAELFPDCVTESRDEAGNVKRAVDFDQLRQNLSDHVVEGPQERYHLNWPGKREALLAANAPIAKTLRPCREESVDFDTTRNLFIEGDNLDALKLLQETYLNQVRLICIDPPYNRDTGKDLLYRDDFSQDTRTYLLKSLQLDGDEVRLVANPDTNGRFHSDWLSMLYPRLRLARTLLANEGIILVHIDDNEVQNLLAAMTEVFGERNFVAILVWNKQHSQQQGLFKRYHEYVVVFAKNADALDNIRGGDGRIDAGAIKKVSRGNPASTFPIPAGTRFDAPDGFELSGTYGDTEQVRVVSGRLRALNGKTVEDVILEAGWTQKLQMEQWFAGKETFDTKSQRVVEFYLNSAGKPKCIKERSRITPPSILPEYGMVSSQTAYLVDLMGAAVFPTPKPVEMLTDFATWFSTGDDIVVDFFAGSATTAEGVLRRNAEDGDKRRYIMIQWPERLDIDNPEQRVAAEYCDKLDVPRTIAELAKERLRRAGRKVVEEAGLNGQSFDVGFRVLKIDTSNMKDVYYRPDEMKPELLGGHVDNIKEDRTDEDLLFQVLLDWGVDLSLPIKNEKIAGKSVFFVDENALAACFETGIDEDFVKALARYKPLRAVFRDAGYGSDDVKINVEQIFRQLSPGTEVKTL
jgi:adenine-specific DNA-methyltransferase